MNAKKRQAELAALRTELRRIKRAIYALENPLTATHRADRAAGMCVCRKCGRRKKRAHPRRYGRICKGCLPLAQVEYRARRRAK